MKKIMTILAAGAALTLGAALFADPPVTAKPDPSTPEQKPAETAPPKPRLANLPIWDQGACEISYYRATDRVEEKERTYTRVQMVNRQWMDPRSAIKVEPGGRKAVPVLKLNISEEIPTENHNYRYMTTVFVNRVNLEFFKLATSSQDWNGTTFKQIQRDKKGLTVHGFSYLGDEGTRFGRVLGKPMAYEALFLLARDVVAGGKPGNYHLLEPMRTLHLVSPTTKQATLVLGEVAAVSVPAGTFPAQQVKLQWEGPATEFVVEVAPPYRLLRYSAGETRGELLQVEYHNFRDPQSKSSFYKPGQAP